MTRSIFTLCVALLLPLIVHGEMSCTGASVDTPDPDVINGTCPTNLCMGAVSILGSMESDCPKACSDKSDEADRDGLPFCEGSPERNATTCGTEKCAATLQSVVDLAEDMIEGLSTCTGDYAVYNTTYVPLGSGYLNMAASSIAGECGVEVDVEIDITTCMGAVSFLGSMESDCPKACSDKSDEADRDGLPFCEGSPERNATTCGTEKCAATLQSVVDHAEDMIEGLSTCTGDYAVYNTTYVPLGSGYWIMAASSIAGECGVEVDVEIDSTSAPTVAAPVDAPVAAPPAPSPAPTPDECCGGSFATTVSTAASLLAASVSLFMAR